MTDLRHDLHVLISIAKVDASLSRGRGELGALPEKLAQVKRRLDEISRAEKEAQEHLSEMGKERRMLEQRLQDDATRMKRYKQQLMEVKKNEEYQAMLQEISHLQKEIDAREERFIILMDELEQQADQNSSFMAEKARERSDLENIRAELEARMREVETEMKELEAEKPKFLSELDPQVKKRYERIMAKLHDYAVTQVADDICQGCHTRIPPQRAVEVRRNDHIITCEGCGRILVFYQA